ncbi:TetR/AcrR family transcriptional regulator [Novosphingobium album (ex Liu et al. 2023)]|uniref:Helix-turn-helix domain containing protein n=1 Tax=Novosphingobium album (ex Liu et al. 2023) TaxID=3031130 RepID=A0ABT5WL13_9SPHN|nr:TetR/AcrR family transcriptional regulator [Novosphingobium album (ex Liu et al. 2023)]MDE8650723.1 helix-turn-helix domain containing protein [Novosphingobium album (ex Liu et al. 2023)]
MEGDKIDRPARKPRADAQRNRALLLQAAKTVFAEKGAEASLDEIARAAGVGAGTLYRHFPHRDALIEAVYRNEMEQLAQAAERFSEALPPVEALRAWMLLFVEYMGTKHAMAAALTSLSRGPGELYAASGARLQATIDQLAENAVRSGEVRLEIEPLELLRAIAAVASVGAGPDWEANARRLVDILIAGIRARPE